MSTVSDGSERIELLNASGVVLDSQHHTPAVGNEYVVTIERVIDDTVGTLGGLQIENVLSLTVNDREAIAKLRLLGMDGTGKTCTSDHVDNFVKARLNNRFLHSCKILVVN